MFLALLKKLTSFITLRTLLVFVAPLYVFSSCSNKNILDFEYETVAFIVLPENIKEVLYDYYSGSGDMSPLVNLDSAEIRIKYIPPVYHGMWPEDQVFVFNDNVELYIPWSGNREGRPFILYKKKFYFLWTEGTDLNIDSEAELEVREMRVVDLQEVLSE